MTLYVPCPRCQGETIVWTSRYGGNDPDVWSIPCDNDRCEDGEVIVWCEGCHNEAVEIVDGLPWCAAHAADMKAELALREGPVETT